jgi:hypothetical protein
MMQSTLLFATYLVMVALNIYAVLRFNRAATDGYSMSYLQPDPSTFAIWGVIYVLLMVLVLIGGDLLYPDVATCMAWSFVANGLWLIANGSAVVYHESFWLAVFILVTYVALLGLAYAWMQVDYLERHLSERFIVFAPISMNFAWVLIACLLNLTNTLMNEQLDFTVKQNRTAIGGPDWAMGVLGWVALLAVVLAWTKSDLAFGAVVVWTLRGVERQQTEGSSDFTHPVSEQLKRFAQAGQVVVVVGCLLGFVARGWWTRSVKVGSEP